MLTKTKDRPKITLDKNYQTLDGRPAKVFSINSTEPYVVLGMITEENGLDEPATWTIDGRYNSDEPGGPMNLVEAKPRIKGWIPLYFEDDHVRTGAFHNEPKPLTNISGWSAIVDVDVAEGEGCAPEDEQ